MASQGQLKSWLTFIANVGDEQGFEVDRLKSFLRVYIDRHHGVAYRIQSNNAGYLQAQQWECDSKGRKGRYGRSVYSMRSCSDVAQFCAVLIASSDIRARRKEDSDEV